MTSLQTIEQRLQHPLPGASAHELMAPSPALPECNAAPREAAVLLLLSPAGFRFPDRMSDLVITLIRRAGEFRHPQELAYPGGFREQHESPDQTALRESSEEVGLDLSRVRILGHLSPVTTVTSGALITPVLGLARYFPELVPNDEVDSILHVPLRTLLRPNARGIRVEQHPELGRRRVPYFLVGSDELWGASAKIMAELLTLIQGDGLSWS